MDNIIVSVVIPVYNEEKHIEKCVKSLLEQDYPADNMECIFADGMSTDRTVEILNGYAEKYAPRLPYSLMPSPTKRGFGIPVCPIFSLSVISEIIF